MVAGETVYISVPQVCEPTYVCVQRDDTIVEILKFSMADFQIPLRPQWVGCSLRVVNALFSCDVYSDGEFVI